MTKAKTSLTGADVVALQSFLVDGGFLTMPAGVSMGYFGQLTKAAVVKYQASVSLPATGFVGPLTVAKLNGTTIVTLPPAACPAGYTCTPVGGTTPGTTTGGITTPGVEGTLTVTSSNAGLPSTLYEGDTMVGVLGLKVEAKTSFIGPNGVYVPAGGIVTTRLESITTSAGTETYVSDTFRASKDGQGNSITL